MAAPLKRASPGPELRSEIVNVTPEMARKIRDTCLFERQRSIAESNVNYLANEMAHDWFVPGTQIPLAVLPNGERRLLNGNHTLEAVVKSGKPIALTFTYVPVLDLEAAGHIYGRLDMQRRRTWFEAYKAAGYIESNVPHSRWINALGASIIIIRKQFKAGNFRGDNPMLRLSRETQLALAKYYGPYLAQLIACLPAVDTPIARMVMRSPVCSVALETMRFQATKATEFWGAVGADSGLRRGEPAKALLDYLRARTGLTGDVRMEQSYVTAHCWNAFFSGDTVPVVQPKRYTIFRLMGTPWHGTYDGIKEIMKELEDKA